VSTEPISSVPISSAELHQAIQRLVPDDLKPLVAKFLQGVDPAELTQRPVDEIVAALSAHRRLAEQRIPGQPNVVIRVPGDDGWAGKRAAVQVVTDDMPFLVDSAVLTARRVGFDVELLIHPVLRVTRDTDGGLRTLKSLENPENRDDPENRDKPNNSGRESFLHLELDGIPNSRQRVELHQAIVTALADVRAAVTDWQPLRARTLELAAVVRQLTAHPIEWAVDPVEVCELLTWMADGHFTLLGAIDHSLSPTGELVEIEGSALGILRAHTDGTSIENIIAPSAAWNQLDVALITKTNSTSTIHRFGHYDIVVIKSYDWNGYSPGENGNPPTPTGERRLVGMFTSDTYLTSPLEIPLLRTKVKTILDRSGFDPTGHSGKELKSILLSHPHDELFATSVDDLEKTAHGIAALAERRRVKVFFRRDSERSVWSCLVYLPRDRYTTDVRQRVQKRLEHLVGGTSSTYTTALTESRLARILFTIPSPVSDLSDRPELFDLDDSLTNATRSWSDQLADGLRNAQFRGPIDRYLDAFPAAYTAETPISQAIDDVASVEETIAANQLIVRIHNNTDEDVDTAQARLSLYSPNQALALADLLPILANLGLRVIDEKAAEVTTDEHLVWIHDLGVNGIGMEGIDPQGPLADRLCEAIGAIWRGDVENDGFNQLVAAAGLTHEQVAILRLYARHSRQLGLGFSLSYIEQTLVEQHEVTALFAQLVATKFDPDLPLSLAERREAIQSLEATLEPLLNAIPSLDQDRILRCLASQIAASTRTNAYQIGRSALCVKLEPQRIPDAPEPRPRYEIFVSSPKVEGVHLRMGSVARGGLRWSDRPEDFRTEVLGLMKAQAVKNAVIVPAGAKGGFVVRQPPATNDRAVIQAEGVACYQAFIHSLLDVTDNLTNGVVVNPPRVVRHDDNDTYLVVAADKGTATFSDIANAISLERAFWLGDAFASGGSVGYDHKAMGITARGAWESVKRHFLRLGRDITSPTAEPFTVLGIGDMSGDVFGNGMLLSDNMLLRIAFDHRHIFIDPTPDPARSFSERQRLFALPRSSWDDYDKTLLSAGGGVWPRTAKSITLSPEALDVLGIGADSGFSFTPTEVIAMALRAPVDLLWNGGIGTYVKASTESHAQVGDRTNDAVRADANQLRCKIIGEGGNLGLTQRARIEFSRLGGLVNTDAIDNSAGVDTSDHEVNLKILVDRSVAGGHLPASERNAFLSERIDDVAQLVLSDNIAQNRVLGTGLAEAPGMVTIHGRYIAALEASGRLNRQLEALPDTAELEARRAAGVGLTLPELSVLLAHAKLSIIDQLLEEGIGADPSFADRLRNYFPQPVVERLRAQVDEHPLRNEIIAMMLANHVVNRNGSTFVFRLADETGARTAAVVRAHAAATDILGVDSFWSAVCALDGSITDAHQNELLLEADRAVERAARWILRNCPEPLDHVEVANTYRPNVSSLVTTLDAINNTAGSEPLAGSDAEVLRGRLARFQSFGIDEALARQATHFEFVTSLLDIAELSRKTSHPLADVADVFLELDRRFRITEIRRRIETLPRDDRWDGLARAALRDDLASEHLTLASVVLNDSTLRALAPAAAVAQWIDSRGVTVQRHLDLMTEIAQTSTNHLSGLSVVLRRLRTLARHEAE
jgi:glutamate dehydrogenase